MRFTGEHIWIIGASSGIGEALARLLAAEGATLMLSARSEAKLHRLNQELYGNHHVYPLDVADAMQVQQVATAVAGAFPLLDRVIYMAGIYNPASIAEMDVAFAKKLLEVNLLGAMQVTHSILPCLTRQTRAQLVLCASVAGYTGLPDGQPYSASKAGLINFAESLRAEAPATLDVKLINPGFVRTQLTDLNDFSMPARLEPEDAAKAIANGLLKRGFEIHFPRRFTYGMKLLKLLPYSIKLRITRLMK